MIRLCAIVMMLPVVVMGAPVVTGVPDTIADGQVIVITGTGFGSKPVQDSPYLWDNLDSDDWPVFAGVTDGEPAPVGTGAPWPAYRTGTTVWYEASPGEVRVYGKPVYESRRSWGGFINETSVPMDSGKVLVMDWWINFNRNYRFNNDGGSTSNKLSRIWTTTGGTDGRTSIYSYFIQAYYAPTDAITNYYTGANDLFVPNVWQHVRLEFESAGISASGGGSCKYYLNNYLIKHIDNTLASSAGAYDKIIDIGFTARSSTLPLGYDSGALGWWHDVYIDNSLARVVLSGSPEWVNSQIHYEMQIPVIWADGSITVTANTGSFTDGDSVYIFVIDSNGAVNTEGYITTVSSVIVPPTLTTKPTNLQVVE